MQPSRKTFQKEGRWIERLAPSKVLLCTCGNKYLKTRPRQETCLRCMHREGKI